NAVQAMPSGGSLEISAVNVSFGRREHPQLAQGAYVKVSIKDHGIGIPADIMPRIFDPFYTTKIKGHGLGLATSYSIIKRHRGCIEVESEQGKGSTFHMYLPATAKAAATEITTNPPRMGGGNVIVIDDEEIVLEVCNRMLQSLGYTASCFSDGKDAIDFYRNEIKAGRRYSVMLCDLTIPGGMGGIEAVKILRTIDTALPVFVVSGYADDPVMQHPRKYGFTDSLPKPFTMAELSGVLGKHVNTSTPIL
ncbi:MAG TPA: ATP-binding protein, partial [Chitinivibrionales bacterium]